MLFSPLQMLPHVLSPPTANFGTQKVCGISYDAKVATCLSSNPIRPKKLRNGMTSSHNIPKCDVKKKYYMLEILDIINLLKQGEGRGDGPCEARAVAAAFAAEFDNPAG